MWAVSARWDAACRSASQTTLVRCEVWRQGSPVLVDGVPLTLSVEGGSVRVDATSKVRRLGTIVVTDVDLMPDDAADVLTPVDTDMRVFMGHRYGEGDSELVPVGTLRVRAAARDSLDGALVLDVHDYMGLLGETGFAGPWWTPAGKLVRDEIARIVHSLLPWVEVIDLTGSAAVTHEGSRDGSLGDAVLDLASAMGADAGFDPLGRLILRRPADGTSASVWTLDTHTATAVVEDASQSVDLVGVYNAAWAECSDPQVPPVGVLVFQETGPLRWRAGFQRVRRFASPLLRTRESCEAAGRTILARSQVYAAQVEPVSAPNPALSEGDTVTLAIEGAPSGTRVLVGFTLALAADQQRMPVMVRMPQSGVSATAEWEA